MANTRRSTPKMTATQFRALWRGGKSRKVRRHRRRIPLANILGFGPFFYHTYDSLRQSWPMVEKVRRIGQVAVNMVTGYDYIEKRFRFDVMAHYGLPIIGGMLVHKYLGRMINKYIPRSIPFEL